MLRYRLPLLIILSLLCGLFAPKLTAQPVYPVRVLTQLTPPYSVYLSDYTAPGVEQLRVMLVQNDLTKPATQIRLSMELQLNGRLVLRTSPAYRPAPLTLTSAMPLVVSGNNLSGFLEPQNLDFIGISRDNYLRTKALPEGAYTLSFTAYDYHRPQVRVSQPGVVAFYLSKSEPPLLNLPLDGQTLEATPLPSVLFQWTPRATASLNSAFDTEYKLQLFEVMVPGSNPYQVVNSSQPVFERSLSTSTYLYGPLDPTLVAGRQYLWRVQARDRSGRDRFRNQGFSQVYEFTYGQDLASQLPLIEGLTATTTGSRARVNWTTNPAFDRYTLQYRRQGEYSWVDQSVTTLPVDIHQLAYDIPYECRVQGIQGVYKSQWSQPVSFTSPKPQPVACGTPYEPKAITNHEPITKLLPMQEVDAGGFTVTILQATPSGDRFSGRGYVQLPFWGNKRFAVTFSNIKVNTDFQLTDGRFVTVFDERNSQMGNIDEVFEGSETRMQTGATSTTFAVNLVLDPNQPVQVNLQGQTLTFTDAQGHTQTLPLPAKATPEAATANNDTTALQSAIDQATVEDSQGNIYRIDYQPGSSSAQLTRIGSSSSGTTMDYPSLSPELAVVSFEAHPSQQYAFDSWNPAYEASQIWESRYEKLGDYRVPFKLLPQGKTDVVKATVQLTDTSLDPGKVVFKSSKGAEFSSTFTNGSYQLTLVGGPANDIQEVYALYPSGDGFKALGKLKVVSYAQKQVSVTLVPTAGQTIDASQLQTGLNQIYNPLGVQVTLSVDRSFTYTGSNPSFTGSGWFDTYTPEMKALNQAYQAHAGAGFKPNEAYVFVLPGSGPIAGDMPRGKQFGYLTGTPGAQVLAHELAHGVFHLKHTFDPDYGLTEGALAQNLMDYRGGALLNKPQWDGLHDPGLVLGVFEKDEDGALIKKDQDIEWVVELYSPQISEKFIEAKKNNNLAEMRRLLDWSLKHSFTDNWLEKVKIGFTLEADRAVATLKHNKGAKYKGIRVYYTKNVYGDGGGLIGVFANDDPLYFPATALPIDVKPYENQTGRVNLALKSPEIIVEKNIQKELDEGLIPTYLWKSGLVDPYAAGIVDGFWETIKSTWGIVKFAAAWDVTSIYNSKSYYFTEEAFEIRLQTVAFVSFINDLATSEDTRQEFKNLVKNELNSYVNEIAALTPEAQYLQGKLLFDAATLFIGVGEVKALLKGEKVSIALITSLKNLPKDLLKVLTKAKNAGFIVEKSGDFIKVVTKDGAEVALISGNKLTIGFKEGKKVPAEIVDELRKIRLKEFGYVYAASKVGTYVEDFTLEVGKVVYCVEKSGVNRPGFFLTTTEYGNDITNAVKELGILKEFKDNCKFPDELVIRKYQIIQELPTRKSVVGEISSVVEPADYKPGGGLQYEVHFNGNWERDWKLYLKEIK